MSDGITAEYDLVVGLSKQKNRASRGAVARIKKEAFS